MEDNVCIYSSIQFGPLADALLEARRTDHISPVTIAAEPDCSPESYAATMPAPATERDPSTVRELEPATVRLKTMPCLYSYLEAS